MHITPDFAGLVAQVYPALLIAVLIEGRLPQPKREVRWTFLTIYLVRYAALVGGTISTFLCLQMAGSNQESDFTDWVVSMSGVALFVAVSFMNGTVMGTEHAGFRSLFGRPTASVASTEVKADSSN